MKIYYVYIMTSNTGTLYTGVTKDLERRVYEHRSKIFKGFTEKYNIKRFVYFEETGDIDSAIAREKQIKSWRRKKEIELVKTMNPTWTDLSEDWFEERFD
jgi:putative endonuclease